MMEETSPAISIDIDDEEMVFVESDSVQSTSDGNFQHSLQYKRAEIQWLHISDLTNDEKAQKIMKLLYNWDSLWALSDLISSKLEIKNELADQWDARILTDIDQRYKDFIPLSIGERHVLQSTPNGNCIFNAVSVALCGSEQLARRLRLAAVVKIVDDLVPFAKYIMEEYNNLTVLWLGAATHSAKSVSSNMTAEELEYILREELVDTVKFPFRDGTILHIHLLCHLLGRPIQQHCIKGDLYKPYKQLLHPPLYDVKYPSPLHVVWVPTVPKSKYASITHVVPAVCKRTPYGTHVEECAFAGLSTCALTYGFNAQITAPYWVECGICGQWVHTRKMSNKEAIVDDIPDSLRNSLFRTSGPFQENFIDSLNAALMSCVRKEDIRLVPDIFMPEVLLCVLMHQEEVNRLLAEMVLMKTVCNTM